MHYVFLHIVSNKRSRYARLIEGMLSERIGIGNSTKPYLADIFGILKLIEEPLTELIINDWQNFNA